VHGRLMMENPRRKAISELDYTLLDQGAESRRATYYSMADEAVRD
jgi:hypothetical protein